MLTELKRDNGNLDKRMDFPVKIIQWWASFSQYFSGFRGVPIIEVLASFKTVNLQSWKVLAFLT